MCTTLVPENHWQKSWANRWSFDHYKAVQRMLSLAGKQYNHSLYKILPIYQIKFWHNWYLLFWFSESFLQWRCWDWIMLRKREGGEYRWVSCKNILTSNPHFVFGVLYFYLHLGFLFVFVSSNSHVIFVNFIFAFYVGWVDKILILIILCCRFLKWGFGYSQIFTNIQMDKYTDTPPPW